MSVAEDLAQPSGNQRRLWGKWIIEELGTDPGGQFMGFCPLHDPEGRGADKNRVPTAKFNFIAGTLHCMGEPCCHNGQYIALGKVVERVASQYLTGEDTRSTVV